MLESLKEVNIKDLTIETPQPPTFDIYNPYSFITDDSLWEEIARTVDFPNNLAQAEYCRYLGYVSRLFPGESYRFEAPSHYLWRSVERRMDEQIGIDATLSYSNTALGIKSISSAQFTELVDNDRIFTWLSKEYVGGLKGRLRFLDTAANVKLLFPNKFAYLGWGEEDLKTGHEHLKIFVSADDLAIQTACLRVIFPDRLNELKLNLGTLEKFVDSIKREYDGPEKIFFLERLEVLQILLATELRFTDQGLVTVLPPKVADFNTEVPLPLRRSF